LPAGGSVLGLSPGGRVPRLSAGVDPPVLPGDVGASRLSPGTDVAVLPVGEAPARPLDAIARGLSADRGPLSRPADGEAPAPSADGVAPLPTAESPASGLVGRADPSVRAARDPSPGPPSRGAPSVRAGRGPAPDPGVPGASSVPAERWLMLDPAVPGAPSTPPGWEAVSGPAVPSAPSASAGRSGVSESGGSGSAGRAVSAIGGVPVPVALPGASGRTMLGASRSTSTTMGMGWVSAKLASSARCASVRLGLALVSVAATTSSMPGAAGSAPASQSRSSLLPGRGPGSPASGLALPSSVAGRDGTR